MEEKNYIKYGIYFVIIGAFFLPLMIVFIFYGGSETQVLLSLFSLLTSIPLLAGIILIIYGFIIRIMDKIFANQPCPICGEQKLRVRGFLKIHCEGCQKEIRISNFGMEAAMRELEEQTQLEKFQNCPECGSPLSMRKGRKFCPFCDEFLD